MHMHIPIHTTSASGLALALRLKEGLPVQPRVAVAAVVVNARPGGGAP